MSNKKIYLVRDKVTTSKALARLQFKSSPSADSTVTLKSFCNERTATYVAVSDGEDLTSSDPTIIKFHRGNSEDGAFSEAKKARDNLKQAILDGNQFFAPSFELDAVDNSAVEYAELKLTQEKGGEGGNTVISYSNDFETALLDGTDPDKFESGKTHFDMEAPARGTLTGCDQSKVDKNWPLEISEEGGLLFKTKVSGQEPEHAEEFTTKGYVDNQSLYLLEKIEETGADLHLRVSPIENSITSHSQTLGQHTSDIGDNAEEIEDLATDLFQTGKTLHERVSTNSLSYENLDGELFASGQLLFNKSKTNTTAIEDLDTDLFQTGKTLWDGLSTLDDALVDLDDNLFLSGKKLDEDIKAHDQENQTTINALSGTLNKTGELITINHLWTLGVSDNLAITGKTLYDFASSNEGAIEDLGDDLFQTGQTLNTKINNKFDAATTADSQLQGLITTNSEDILKLETATGHQMETAVRTYGDQLIDGQKAFVEGVEIGHPLEINIGGPISTTAIKITETDSNHFAIGADYSGDQDKNRLYISSRGAEWGARQPPEIQENILTITANGNVGVGIKDPNYKLQINGPAHATSFVNMSDKKYKKDITVINGALDKVKSIEGVTFKWNEETYPYDAPEGEQVGLIAQDVEKIMPDIVSTDSSGDKSISYDRLTPLLIEAIKEQQKTIDDLKEEVENLKNN